MKLMLLRTLGVSKDQGFVVAGDELGRHLVINIVGIYLDEAQASVECLARFYDRIEKNNRTAWIGRRGNIL